jgi:hypothetical protein
MAEPPKAPAAPAPADPAKTQEAVAKDAEMKAIEEVLSRRILDRLTYDYGYPYGNPHYYPINPELAYKIGSLRAYHDYVLGWELENAVAGLVAPSIEEVAKVLEAITNTSGMKNPEEAKKAAAAAPKPPAAATFVQTEAEGVPVLVVPTLLENEAAHEDLKQRNIMMDGVNGYDFVQTKAEGIPVLVNPESMIKTDTITDVGMGEMTIGIDDVHLLQTKPLDDNLVTLQVNGVPVLVNPESMIKTDTMSSVGIS